MERGESLAMRQDALSSKTLYCTESLQGTGALAGLGPQYIRISLVTLLVFAILFSLISILRILFFQGSVDYLFILFDIVAMIFITAFLAIISQDSICVTSSLEARRLYNTVVYLALYMVIRFVFTLIILNAEYKRIEKPKNIFLSQ